MSNFYATVIQKDSRFTTLGRVSDVALLEPTTAAKVQAIIAGAMADYGVKLIPWETYRSFARQMVLFSQGATKLKQAGVHHWGLACDLVKEINGEPSWKGDFSFLCTLAHKNGLISGYDWGNPSIKHTFIDADHVQFCSVKRQNDLFSGAWYPDSGYDPYKDA